MFDVSTALKLLTLSPASKNVLALSFQKGGEGAKQHKGIDWCCERF